MNTPDPIFDPPPGQDTKGFGDIRPVSITPDFPVTVKTSRGSRQPPYPNQAISSEIIHLRSENAKLTKNYREVIEVLRVLVESCRANGLTIPDEDALDAAVRTLENHSKAGTNDQRTTLRNS